MAAPRLCALVARIERTLRNEDGIALVMALGVMLVLSISSASMLLYTSSNSRSASFSGTRQSGTALAEAGVEYARATLWSLPPARWSADTTLPTQTVTVDGRTVTYWGTRSGNVWTLSGRATLGNPSGGAALTSTVRSDIRVTMSATANDPRGDAAWQYIFVASTGCTTLNDNANVGASMYLAGSLCMNDSTQFNGTRLHVKGTLNLSGNAAIGVSRQVSEVKVRGGCTGGCNTNPKINGRDESGPPPDVVKPNSSLALWYASAKPGPAAYCTTGSFPGGFDNDTIRNVSRPTVDLFPATAYDCQYRDATNALVGRLAWTPGAPGTLTIVGTIFFDGSISVNEYEYAVVSGRGTIYSSGTVTINDNARVCGIAACNSTWNPATSQLTLVAGGCDSYGNSFAIRDSAVYQGGAYSECGFTAADNTQMYGPILTTTFRAADTSRFNEVSGFTLLPGMPTATTAAPMLENVNGSYRRSG